MCALKKLKLNIEELEVASFDIPMDTDAQGSVQGQLAAETMADCSWHCGDPFSTLYYYYAMITA